MNLGLVDPGIILRTIKPAYFHVLIGLNAIFRDPFVGTALAGFTA